MLDNNEAIELFRNSLDGMLLTRPDGTIIAANPAACALFGYSEEELVALGGAAVLDRDDPRLAVLLKAREATGYAAGELRMQRKDGTRFEAQISSRIFTRADGALRTSMIVRDVTTSRKAEEEMRRFRAAMDVSPDLVLLVDPTTLRYIDMNAAATRRLGYSREELLRLGPCDLFSVSPEALRNTYARLIAGDLGAGTTTGVYRTKDGTPLPFESNRGAVPSEGGYVIVSVARDISQRLIDEELLRKAEARYRSMIAVLAEGIIVRDADGIITDCNASAERILGGARDQMVGSHYAHPQWEVRREDGTLVQIEDRPSWRAIQTGKMQSNVVLSFKKPDGTVLWLSLNAQPLYDPAGTKIVGAVTTLTDVTERKHAEEEIRRINAELEARVEARTIELEVANRDLQSFSYSVSHDLRAPIRAIGSHARLLMLGEPVPQSEERLRRFRAIERNAGLMSNLVDALLNLSRVNRNVIQKQPLDLEAIARAVLADLQPDYPGTSVIVEELPPGEGEPTLVRQVFANLLSNAFKFSSRVTSPEVTVGWDAQAGCWFVRDNGAGFDMQFARKLFGAFERVHGADEFEGTGIGLAIVHRILERHSGRIWAEGAEGRGATFRFTLG